MYYTDTTLFIVLILYYLDLRDSYLTIIAIFFNNGCMTAPQSHNCNVNCSNIVTLTL